MRKNLTILFLLLSIALPSTMAAQTKVEINSMERRMAEAITARQLKQYLYFVASDEMEGRDTPSRGLDLTAKFIALMLERWGLKPAGDNGTFFQNIALRSDSIDPENTFVKIGSQTFALNEDVFRMGGTGTVADAPLVFGGNGWMVKAKNIDALAGVDARGKIVVLSSDGFPNPRTLTPVPQGVTQADLSGTRGTDWADPVTNAAQNGAAGIILVGSSQVQGAWGQIRNFFSRGGMYPEKLREGNNNNSADSFPVMLVSQKAGDALFSGETANQSSNSAFAFKKTATISAKSRAEIKNTQNVVAVW